MSLHGTTSSSLWYKDAIIYEAAFGQGSRELLTPENRKVLAFIRRDDDEAILVVANLSRFLQDVQLDLAAFCGRWPVELFGRTTCPPARYRWA
jgi:maltose alpha-D-glucosyltransferase / alpha-amylase